jgi:hypothetical protein
MDGTKSRSFQNRDLVLPALNLRFLIPEIPVIVFKSCYIFLKWLIVDCTARVRVYSLLLPVSYLLNMGTIFFWNKTADALS